MITVADRNTTSPDQRLGELHARLQTLAGQLNVIHAEITEVVAEVTEQGLLGGTGLQSVSQWLEWQLGLAPGAARQLVAIGQRRSELPDTIAMFDHGRLSVDQVGAVARRAPTTLDAHFADTAPAMTVRQLRKAITASVPPRDAGPDPIDGPRRDLHHGFDDQGGWFLTVRTDTATGAAFDAALRTHFDALLTQHRAHRARLAPQEQAALTPPTWFDAFEALAEAGVAVEAAARPWNTRTKVVVHLRDDHARLHLGPALTSSERALLTCDSSIQTVLTRFGTPVNVGREHRITPGPTRMVVEARDQGCRHPLCRRTGTLVVHHIQHWEHGGPTDTANLVCLCPAHHRGVHRGEFHITGNPDSADDLEFRDRQGRQLVPPEPGSGQDPPAPTRRYQHPTGERINWLWYTPPAVPPPGHN